MSLFRSLRKIFVIVMLYQRSNDSTEKVQINLIINRGLLAKYYSTYDKSCHEIIKISLPEYFGEDYAGQLVQTNKNS